MSAILKFDFQKKKKITFLWSKLSKLHKKDPILHVTTTFSLKLERFSGFAVFGFRGL